MRVLLAILQILPLVAFSRQDPTVTLSSVLRYGTSRLEINPIGQNREYFESLTDTRISFRQLRIGFRLLHDAPPEVGSEFTGMEKRYLEFTSENLYVRVGNSFSLYGRGLSLNMFENRTLGFDTGIDGAKAEYRGRPVFAAMTGGDISYADVLDQSRVERYRVRAGIIEVTPHPFLTAGISFVTGRLWFPTTPAGQSAGSFNMPEVFLTLRFSDFDIYASYVEKRTDVSVNPLALVLQGYRHRGTGAYASVSYTGGEMGISLEYKDYRFGIADPVRRQISDRAPKALAFQNPPIAHKEHSFTLLTRYPHVIDFNDEVGFQIDAFAALSDRLLISANAAVASKHYSFRSTGILDPVTGFDIHQGRGRRFSWMPSFRKEYSPFWEVYGDVQYYFGEGSTDYLVLAFNRREDQISLELNRQIPLVELIRSVAVPILVQHRLTEALVLVATSERQWVRDETNILSPVFVNQLFSLGIIRSPSLSATLRYEFTNATATVDGRTNWAALDLGYRFNPQTNFLLTIGVDRGGQVCSNGVCRIVPPFRGLRASLITYF